MKPYPPRPLTKAEYREATRADHGTLRRFLAGCRCERCDRPAHRLFARRDAFRARGEQERMKAAG